MINKTVTLFLVILFAISLLTACSVKVNDGGGSGNVSANGNASDEAASEPVKQEGTDSKSPDENGSDNNNADSAATVEGNYNIADYYNENGTFSDLGQALPFAPENGERSLTVKGGDVVIVGGSAYTVTVESLTLYFYTQPSFDEVITWWGDYFEGLGNEIVSVGNASPVSNNGGSVEENAPAQQDTPVKPARAVEIPAGPLDLSDDSIYFVIIEGVKYNLLDVTVGDFLANGYSLKEYDDENRIIEAGKLGGKMLNGLSDLDIFKSSTSWECFYVLPINRTDNDIPLKDCTISWIWFQAGNSSDFDISITNNLALGCTEEDVVGVFGDDFEPVNYEQRGVILYNEGTLMNPGRKFHFYGTGSDPVTRIMIELQ